MKRIIFSAAFAAFMLLSFSSFGQDAYSEITAQNIVLKWRVDGANLNIIISAPTTGWISVGFDPTNRMKDSNIIIGYVKNGQAVLRDDYGHAPVGHKSDESSRGTDNISNAEGSEQNNVTELRFTIPLNSGDRYDRVLVPGRTYKVNLAHGKKGQDNFNAYHAARTQVEITL